MIGQADGRGHYDESKTSLSKSAISGADDGKEEGGRH